MERILGCPPEADIYARALGRAYQIINFVRDYEEDLAKGYEYISANHDIYIRLFRENLEEGMEGINYIPEELRGPIFKANKAYSPKIINSIRYSYWYILYIYYKLMAILRQNLT